MTNAADIMNRKIHSVDPDMTLPDLERTFIAHGVSALPVIEDGKLTGIVSRSDVVRQLCLEQSQAEILADGRDAPGADTGDEAHRAEIGQHLGHRIVGLTVAHVMIREPVSVPSDTPLAKLAGEMTAHHVHSLLVIDGGELKGIITAYDLVRMIANGGLS